MSYVTVHVFHCDIRPRYISSIVVTPGSSKVGSLLNPADTNVDEVHRRPENERENYLNIASS